MAIVGYARVSTNGQDYNGQIGELEAAGCERIYREKVSGATLNRLMVHPHILRHRKKGGVLSVRQQHSRPLYPARRFRSRTGNRAQLRQILRQSPIRSPAATPS
jgi:hypothetical protein